ncbi:MULTISPECIES: V-type ATPase 116kDa subunit family protein [unclassified Proteus (in: enterobacteria)]|uniref:V-type ATPase 116kDa subunit family protein n=1 Tax=unclassified Proteus (in: enterobacteria) TaxID=257482 RepID=UPI001376F590|nr:MULTISPECIES: V-type ATPase 116kDa subunit family protein [unclassified Proteus (in: enterobacteria)]NBM11045.1 hypothetical protein [Proteus sp. G2670]NBM31868.1 hypothetical protein [Proteus sp. G2664]
MNNQHEAIEKATDNQITIAMRPVYIIAGANRAYLSERSALNKLANILTERELHKEGIETNYEGEQCELEDGTIAFKRGEPTEHFMERKEAKLTELHERLKQERNIERLQKEYDKAVDKYNKAEEEADRLFYKLNNALTNK